MNDYIGLKELRIINSGGFKHEVIDIEKPTFLVGSNGAGKTTTMSCVCYFYTLDHNKARPDNQDMTFYQWHLNSEYSYLMYKYSNRTGEKLLILSKEKSVKYMLIDIDTLNEDISVLYEDKEGNVDVLSRIREQCTIKGLDFIEVQKGNLKTILSERESKRLPIKLKSIIDYSIYPSIDTLNEYGNYVYTIYKSSVLEDRKIKDMIINLKGANNTSLNISSFRNSLNIALENIELISLMKKKKPLIQEIERIINKYTEASEDRLVFASKVNLILSSSNNIENYINTKIKTHSEIVNTYNREINKTKENKSETIKDIKDKMEDISLTIRDLNRQKEKHTKHNTEELLKEDKKEQKYESELIKFNSKYSSLTSDINDLQSKIKETKQKIQNNTNKQKNKELESLNAQIDQLNPKLNTLYETENGEVENRVKHIKSELKETKELYSIKEHKLIIAKATLEAMSKSPTSPLIDDLANEVKTLKHDLTEKTDETDSLKSKQNNTYTEAENSFKTIQINKEKNEKMYEEETRRIDNEIFSINKKLNYNKKNIYGYIHKNSIPNKESILAVLNEEFLFDENIEFKVESGSLLYGLNIKNGLERHTGKYNSAILEDKKEELKEKRGVCIVDYNNKSNLYKEKESDIEKRRTKELKILSGQIAKAASELNSIKKRLHLKEFELKEAIQAKEAEIKNKIESNKKTISELESEISIFNDTLLDLSSKINKIKIETKNEFISKRKMTEAKIKKLNTEKENINKTFANILRQRFAIIDEEFNESLKEQNIDTDEVKKLNSLINDLKNTIENISKNKSLVYDFMEIKDSLKTIPDKEKLLETYKEELESKNEYFNKIIKKKQAKIEEKSSELSNQTNILESFNTWKVDTNKKFKSLGFAFSEVNYLNDEEVEFILKNRKYEESFVELENLLSDIKKLRDSIINKAKIVTTDIPQSNALKLRRITDIYEITLDGDINDYIDIMKNDYIRCINSEIDIQGASMQVKAIREFIYGSNDTIKNIKEDAKIIQDEVKSINSTLKEAVKNLKVIDYITLKFDTVIEDDMLSKTEDLAAYLDKEHATLFSNNKRSNEIIDKIIDNSKKIQLLANNNSKKEYTLSDLSSLTFDISENGKEHKNLSLVKTVGSNGTTIMVKTLIILSLLKKASAGSDKNHKKHCLLDEIGALSADNFSQILLLASSFGFTFINASATIDDDMLICYDNAYMATRDNGVATVTRLVNHNPFEEFLENEIN